MACPTFSRTCFSFKMRYFPAPMGLRKRAPASSKSVLEIWLIRRVLFSLKVSMRSLVQWQRLERIKFKGRIELKRFVIVSGGSGEGSPSGVWIHHNGIETKIDVKAVENVSWWNAVFFQCFLPCGGFFVYVLMSLCIDLDLGRGWERFRWSHDEMMKERMSMWTRQRRNSEMSKMGR